MKSNFSTILFTKEWCANQDGREKWRKGLVIIDRNRPHSFRRSKGESVMFYVVILGICVKMSAQT